MTKKKKNSFMKLIKPITPQLPRYIDPKKTQGISPYNYNSIPSDEDVVHINDVLKKKKEKES